MAGQERGEWSGSDLQRFRQDVEFIELLANPEYLHTLAVRKYFDDALFLSYLSALRKRFSEPSFSAWIRFPVALTMLHLLQDPLFRKELLEPAFFQYIHSQMVLHWTHAERTTPITDTPRRPASNLSV
eukprot:ANDGO_05606.mRNA.1 Mediator of RNA polymerase II transcription subunit 31